VNLLEAVRACAPQARVLWVSTCEVYGAAASLPLAEDAPLRPANPYAVSKTTGDLLAAMYAEVYGLDVVRARPFSHAGPGQRSIFIMSNLARQAAAARIAGERALRVVTGNPATRRDFTDVRDVVRAYRLLVERGVAGETYQVCSGSAVSVAQVARRLCDLAGVTVELQRDPQLARPLDVPVMVGDSTKLRAATGWAPARSLDETLADTLAWWRDRRA
jgi:GDP-4-dehydro-6-deoxy-D-mannose reductase